MLTLSRGADLLVVAPEHGGAIVGWMRGGTHVLRHPSPDAVLRGLPGAMGCFPLVPFANRIAQRRFQWAGRGHELAANFGDHPHAIHGVGWQSRWRIEHVTPASVTLSLRHDALGQTARHWPFAFAASLTYLLTETGLAIRIEATNLHAGPAPMGLGVHPYFPRPANAAITFQAEGVWRNHDALPVTHTPIPPAWDHAHGRAVDQAPLDNCFTGWHGTATVPGLRIEADALFGNLQVFTPSGADFVCAEPVSHVPDAINRPELPAVQAMAQLASGQTIGGTISFSPSDGAGKNLPRRAM